MFIIWMCKLPYLATKQMSKEKIAVVVIEMENNMLEIIAGVLVVLWILGFVTAHTIGGFIHILLVIAIVMILIRIIRGKKL